MSDHIPELDYLRIPFDAIKQATNNFAPQNFIGRGGFGPVYKGQLPTTSLIEPGANVAVKRLDVKGGQGEQEFMVEIVMLASYKHDNLVSLIGFADEGNEKDLVYKHKVNGSLDRHLTNLTWEQYLRICLGAAQGLQYLHDGGEKGPTNVQFTLLITNASGTLGYVDPAYAKTGLLTKESDVYSFGVVLFEVLCGRPAVMLEYKDDRRILSNLMKFHHEKNTLHDIINPNLLPQMKPYTLPLFSGIALDCLKEDRKERPTMNIIVQALESALKRQTGRTKLWGNVKGGRPFLFQLEKEQKLRMMTIYHDQWIHALAFVAQDSNGLMRSSERHGGFHDNRSHKFKITFEEDEEIIGITGTVKEHSSLTLITSLSLKTNKKEHGPFGEVAGTLFSESWDFGLFNGFYGRCGWYVDALGCCLKVD